MDVTIGMDLLSMIDAFQGYHQMPLASEDSRRVCFMTPFDTYNYKIMPFGLKNTRAAYQQMVDKMFDEQIRCEIWKYLSTISWSSLRERKVTNKFSKKHSVFWKSIIRN